VKYFLKHGKTRIEADEEKEQEIRTTKESEVKKEVYSFTPSKENRLLPLVESPIVTLVELLEDRGWNIREADILDYGFDEKNDLMLNIPEYTDKTGKLWFNTNLLWEEYFENLKDGSKVLEDQIDYTLKILGIDPDKVYLDENPPEGIDFPVYRCIETGKIIPDPSKKKEYLDSQLVFHEVEKLQRQKWYDIKDGFFREIDLNLMEIGGEPEKEYTEEELEKMQRERSMFRAAQDKSQSRMTDYLR
jgi:hypothetical protein